MAQSSRRSRRPSDIRQVTELARQMVEEWGMDDEMGFVHYGQREGGPATSPGTARRIEEHITRWRPSFGRGD